MGGAGTAMRDNLTINFVNPASYSSLDTNSFIFDFGIDYGLNFISDETSSDLSDDLNFDHLTMGFPVSRRWGVAIGLIPLSNGYYNISESVLEGDPGYDPVTGEYTSFHKGGGGLSSFFIGTGFNISKNISAGANMSVIFGSLRRSNEFDFNDYFYTYQTSTTEKYSLAGIGLDLGLQYEASLKNDYFINIGLSYGLSKHLKSNFETLTYRFNLYSTADTLVYLADDSEKAFIPATLRTGIFIGKKNKWNAGLDYIYTKWSDASLAGSDGYLTDVQSLLAGIEYTPDRFANYGFMRRIDYRAGVHFGGNYLSLEGNPVKEKGVSIGVGIPLRRTYSKVNFFADYTQRSLDGGSIIHKEDYFTFGLSINMFDIWFLKQKYN